MQILEKVVEKWEKVGNFRIMRPTDVPETKVFRRNGELMLQTAHIADLCGVSVQTVRGWSKEPGWPTMTTDGYYSARLVGDFIRRVQVTKPGKNNVRNAYPYAPEGWGPIDKSPRVDIPGKPEKEDKIEAETRLKVAQANKIELDLAVAEGRLIEVDVVASAWASLLTRVRSRLLKLPSAVAPLVVGDPNMSSIQGKLKDAVHDALNEASVDWRDDSGKEADDE